MVVNNVISLAQVAQAIQGKPVTERYLTITGEVKNPAVISVPIGASYTDIINFAGGITTEDPVIIDGGPMMGRIIKDWDAGTGKTTSGIIVLPSDHFLINMYAKPFSQIVKQFF